MTAAVSRPDTAEMMAATTIAALREEGMAAVIPPTSAPMA